MPYFHNRIWITMLFMVLSTSYYTTNAQSLKEIIYKLFDQPLRSLITGTKKAIYDFEVSFLLFNKDSDGLILKEGNESNWESNFADNRPCVFLTHGWRTTIQEEIQSIIKAYNKVENVNLIVVDWGEVSQAEYILLVTTVVTQIGKKVGDLLIRLNKDGKCDLSKSTHLIGHSLGSHVMGLAGKVVQNELNQQVYRITGLDVASPVIMLLPPESRLMKTDASFVDAIHTDSLAGIIKPIGHVDFYPNNGMIQPRCWNFFFADCNHLQAYFYYAQSVYNNTAFPATQCQSYWSYIFDACEGNNVTFMGISTPPSTRGNYYLTITNSILQDVEEKN